jgi:acyl-coenzyme A thioesterase PaaI-like protein
MLDPEKFLIKARSSKYHLWWLNFFMAKMVPFNRPHGFKITEITEDSVKTYVPYKKANHNHIKGIHACALATISEFTTGLALINKLGFKKYRLIMQKFEIRYHYQAKEKVTTEYVTTDDWIENQIIKPLETQDAVVVNCEVKTLDLQNNHITTANIFWQVKDWEKVKTRLG